MANIAINGLSALGSQLTELLMQDDIVPGAAPSYQTCKVIYMYHPLGAKMAETPVRLAQSQGRDIIVPLGPSEALAKRFNEVWKEIGASKVIFQHASLSRVYGTASVALMPSNIEDSDKPLDLKELRDFAKYPKLSFNVFDPMNTSGSLLLSQDPNSPDFLKGIGITVSGRAYHPSRTCVMMHEMPIYIGYSASGFGFVGRSVYQRALFPLKSYINTMRTDDLVTRKAGLLVAMMKQAGSIVNNLMAVVSGEKRQLLKEAQTDDVLSIGDGEKIESIDLKNLEGPAGQARKNILENVALCADMPAKIINMETFAEGFGEGTEDAKNVARYIDGVREDLGEAYTFMDLIVMYRAWTPEFFKNLQATEESLKGKRYEDCFRDWVSSFEAVWPSLLTEPDSEKVKVDDVKLKGIISVLEILLPKCPPDQAAILMQWASDNLNEMSTMFMAPLLLDYEEISEYEPPPPLGMDESGADSEPPESL